MEELSGVRVMSDWTLYPVYVERASHPGRYDLSDDRELAELFALPQHVLQAIEDWERKYEEILDWSYPPDTDWRRLTENGYYDAGRAVCRLLRQHLPPHIEIEYCAIGDIGSEYY